MAADDLTQQLHRAGHELLGDWFLKPALQQAWQPLPLEWFPDPRLRSVAEAANAGVRPDDLPLALSRNGHRAVWDNAADASTFLLEVPTRSLTLEQHTTALRGLVEKRKLRDGLFRLQHHLDQPIDKTLIELRTLRDAAEEATTPALQIEPFATTPIAELFQPLGTPPWLCEALAMQPGAPIMLSGHSGLGKSWLSYDLALAVASGQLFGGCAVRQGKVRWFHLEGSKLDLSTRLQRLSLARHLGPTDLDGQLYNEIYPDFNFSDPKLERRLMQHCDGFALSVIDTFAVASSGMKENDSSIRRPLDMLARVSDRTGCTFLVIHHNRKDPQDARLKSDDPQGDVRGSSALINAISTGWAVSRVGKRKDNAPDIYFRSRLQLTKCWYGQREDLHVTGWRNSTGGVEVWLATPPEAEAVPAENHGHLDQEIFDTVSARPDVTLRALSELLGKRRNLIADRCRALEADGRLKIIPGKAGAWALQAIPTASG